MTSIFFRYFIQTVSRRITLKLKGILVFVKEKNPVFHDLAAHSIPCDKAANTTKATDSFTSLMVRLDCVPPYY